MVWRVELEFDERASCHTPSNHFTTSILSNSLFPAWILPTRINNFTCIDWNSSTTMEGLKKKRSLEQRITNLGYLIYLKKEETTSETRTKEKKKEKSCISGSKVENSNERSRRKFVRFLEWNPLSRLCIWGSVDKALPSLRQLMTQSGSGWLSLYKGLGYTRGRTSQCAECTCLAAFINTVARTQLRTSERERERGGRRIPRRVSLHSPRSICFQNSFDDLLPPLRYTRNYRDSSLRRD